MRRGISTIGCTSARQRRPKCMYRLLFANDFFGMRLGSRSYVSGLVIGSRAVALLGLRSLRGLISCKVDT